MKAYGLDLRERSVSFVNAGGSKVEAARRFGVAPGDEFPRGFAAEIHALELDVSAVRVGGDIDTGFAAAAVGGFDAVFPANGCGLDLSIRIEGADLRNAICGPPRMLLNCAVIIVSHLF